MLDYRAKRPISTTDVDDVQLPYWPKLNKSGINETPTELYDEALKLKQNLNVFKDENVKLKARVMQFGNALSKKEKIIKELYQHSKMTSGKPPKRFLETPAVIELKRQLIELKEEDNKKQQEISDLKNALKVSKFKELDMQLRASESECIKLKETILKLVAAQSAVIAPSDVAMMERKIKEQSSAIQNYKAENLSLVSAMESKENELNKYKETAVQLDKRVGQAENTNKEEMKLKKAVADSNKEIEKLKEELELYKVNNKENELEVLKSRVDDFTKRQTKLSEEVNKKGEEIQKLEDKLAALNKDPQIEIKQLKAKIESCI
jgi:chromosome segregation ATPase